VMLADNVFEHSIEHAVDAFRTDPSGARVILTEMSDASHLSHLGVAKLGDDGVISEIVEKPADPPSRFAVTGVYCYESSVFDIIQTLEPSGRGELEITDVNNFYAREGRLRYDVVQGFWGDAGESIDGYYAVNDFVRANGANLTPVAD